MGNDNPFSSSPQQGTPPTRSQTQSPMPMQPPGAQYHASPDDEYLERLAGRVERLERSEITVRQDIARTRQEKDRLDADLRVEFASLQAELRSLDREVLQAADRIRETLRLFKNAAKQNDMQRLQSRVDAWAPQNRITRDQFKRLLTDGATTG